MSIKPLKKRSTTIHEDVRRTLGISRDIYAFCAYVHYRCADSRQKRSGWCCDNKQDVADFVGVTRRGLYKMAERVQEIGLIEISGSGDYRTTPKWIDAESKREQSSQNKEADTGNKVPKKREQSSQKNSENGNKVPNRTLYTEIENKIEGERNTPATNPSNLQSQKNESGLVSPPGFGNFDHFSGFGLDYLKTPETVKAETPPLPKVAPKGIPPVRLDAKEIRGLVDLTETYPFGFCETCQGQKVVGGRNGLIECPTCEGTGLGNGRTESENPPPAQFEVTAIASPTELPGVTLVEAAPIHHRRNGRIEIPDEAAAEILPWAKGDGEQTVKSWYDRAFRQHSPKDVEDMVMRFSTVFLSSEKAAFRDMMETNPLSFFKRRFAGFVADQKQYDRNNAPKEGGATRQTPPQNYTSQTRH
jgi:hypothetical protein